MRGACGMRSCSARVLLVFRSCFARVLLLFSGGAFRGAAKTPPSVCLGLTALVGPLFKWSRIFLSRSNPKQPQMDTDGPSAACAARTGFGVRREAKRRRFGNEARFRKAVSPLRSATALHIIVVRTRSCTIVIQDPLQNAYPADAVQRIGLLGLGPVESAAQMARIASSSPIPLGTVGLGLFAKYQCMSGELAVRLPGICG